MAAILIALRAKGESPSEIAAFAQTMLEFADLIAVDDPKAIDIVGTGGDGANLFNVSTASAFVVAAAGGTVAKHGNRGVSTLSGSSDLLSQAGVRLDVGKARTKACIDTHGIGFLFAPNHHRAMKNAAGVRALLGARTIFNLLGPLTNPARVRRLLVGVYDTALLEPMAKTLASLGAERALVVHAQDGLDEYSLASATRVCELKNGRLTAYATRPEDVGLRCQNLDGLRVDNASQSLALIQTALAGKSDDAIVKKAQDMIALNAGAALYLADKASDHASGVQLALQIIHSGAALNKMHDFAKATQIDS